jgi:hypothetical protein
MLLFFRSSEIAIDARLGRYSRALTHANLPHAVIYWKREAENSPESPIESIPYDAPLPFRSRWKSALRLIGLNLFVVREVWRRRRVVSLLHAIDLDTVLAAWLSSKLTGIPFIYDIYDHYPDSRGIGGWLRKFLGKLENAVMRDAALVILADKCRIRQHDKIPADRCVIIENVPDFSRRQFPAIEPRTREAGEALRIGYLGTLEPQCRGIEHILALVEAMPELELEIVGTGALGESVQAAADRCSRIRFHGPMAQSDGLALMQTCHLVLGLYYTCNPNHRYAAPNKYFEHLFIGRPLLTTLGTPPGEKVLHHATGWAVADNAVAIRSILEHALANPSALAIRGRNAARLWDTRFAQYSARTINCEYVHAISKLANGLSQRHRLDLA